MESKGSSVTKIVIVGIFLSSLVFVFSAHAETDIETLAEYFDLLASGNYESASQLWTAACQERAQRFDITFDDIIIKADCGSPVVRDLETMRYHLQPPVKMATKLDPPNYSRLEFSTVVNGRQVSHNYYVYGQDQYYWLIFPQDYFSRDWPVKESKYFRIHYHHAVEPFLHPITMEAADQFVVRIADSLRLPKQTLQTLEQKKIEYFYCDNDSTVKDITGFLIKGTYDLGSNDVISAFFPHYHEISHLLVNLKLKSLPLYSLPIFREGIAVYWGGRWGKAPAALSSLGAYLYKEDIVSLDSLLTMSGFEMNTGSDIAYPVAGLFAGFLREEIGPDKFFDLYRSYSSSFEQLNRLSTDAIRLKLAEQLGKPAWSEVKKAFDEYVASTLQASVELIPGAAASGKESISDGSFRVVDDGQWLSLTFAAKGGEVPAGNLLFDKEIGLAEYRSSLFEDQYKREKTFEGYRYGIRFDKNEAGLYDYATNHLLAKYIWGISPSEDYYQEESQTVSFRLSKALLNGTLPNKDNYLLLDN